MPLGSVILITKGSGKLEYDSFFLSDKSIYGSLTFSHWILYDFIGVSVGILPNLDNGVMAWKKSVNFDRQSKTWSKELLRQGRTGSDQQVLAKAQDFHA
jgi:hypothetical protein